MSGRHPPATQERKEAGFALLIVLWTLVLICFLTALVAASGRTEIRIARNLITNGETAAAADGAVYQTIFHLIPPRPELGSSLNGSVHEVLVGNTRVIVRLSDEAGRINPNLASPALLEALLRTIGREPNAARQLTAAIGDWIGNSPTGRSDEAIASDYRQAGLNYAPPGAQLQSLGELGAVLGMTPETLAALRPHLSLFAPVEPNPALADPVVAAALSIVNGGNPVLPVSADSPDTITVRIEAEARGVNNASVDRLAITKVGASQPNGYTILAWDAGAE